MQATPKKLVRYNDKVSLTYNKGLEAREGSHYYRCDGGTYYVKYKVKDDPAGLNQMKECILYSYCKAKPSKGRTINSYYVHTWDSMSVAVSVSAYTDRSVSLSVTPKKNSKSFKAYSYVTFDF